MQLFPKKFLVTETYQQVHSYATKKEFLKSVEYLLRKLTVKKSWFFANILTEKPFEQICMGKQYSPRCFLATVKILYTLTQSPCIWGIDAFKFLSKSGERVGG